MITDTGIDFRGLDRWVWTRYCGKYNHTIVFTLAY